MEIIIKVVIMLVMGLIVGLMAGDENWIGKTAPEVKAINQDSAEVDFAVEYKKGLVLVYFYPKADTPGCTAQACSLRDSYEDLSDQGVQIFGVSKDNVESQKKFKEKYNLPFTLIADTDKKVIKAFGVSTTFGFASRQAFLIKDGIVIWHDSSASTKEQADDVKRELEKLKN